MQTYLTEMRLSSFELLQFGRQHGLSLRDAASDPAYLTHSWLVAAFGDDAPRPFRVLDTSRDIRVVGYTGTELRPASAKIPAPLLAQTLRTVPVPRLPAGTKLAFNLKTSPVRRNGSKDRDAFLWALDNGQEVTREQAYRDWLSTRIPGARIGSTQITGFSLEELVRKAHRTDEAPRTKHRITAPVATFSGSLEVIDELEFLKALRGGVGRGKGLGHGMLIVRPA